MYINNASNIFFSLGSAVDTMECEDIFTLVINYYSCLSWIALTNSITCRIMLMRIQYANCWRKKRYWKYFSASDFQVFFWLKKTNQLKLYRFNTVNKLSKYNQGLKSKIWNGVNFLTHSDYSQNPSVLVKQINKSLLHNGLSLIHPSGIYVSLIRSPRNKNVINKEKNKEFSTVLFDYFALDCMLFLKWVY